MGDQIDLFSREVESPTIPSPTTKEHNVARLGGIGILTAKDISELGAGCRRVYKLMKDGKWHSPREIRMAAGTDGFEASEGLRRMRELRKWYEIERKRDNMNSRLFLYRLTEKG